MLTLALRLADKEDNQNAEEKEEDASENDAAICEMMGGLIQAEGEAVDNQDEAHLEG